MSKRARFTRMCTNANTCITEGAHVRWTHTDGRQMEGVVSDCDEDDIGWSVLVKIGDNIGHWVELAFLSLIQSK